MKTYTITLSEADDLAFNTVAMDPEDWINNSVSVRVEAAKSDIVKIAVEKYLELGLQVPSSKEDIIFDAVERGWVLTAQEQHFLALQQDQNSV